MILAAVAATLLWDGVPKAEPERWRVPLVEPCVISASGPPETPIQVSIQAAVDQVLLDKIRVLELKLQRVEQVADATSSCGRAAFWWAGTDLISTSGALSRCPDCREANPLGTTPEARVGLKVAQLGIQIDQCYRAAKKGKKASGLVTWVNRGIQGAAALNNFISAITRKPFIRWD